MAFKAGTYKHYKGKYYIVYCEAYDNKNRYVLYQQNYADKAFWLRPYDMFFETVTLDDGKQVPRFSFSKNEKSVSQQISKLISLLKDKKVFIKDTELNIPFSITEISESLDHVSVAPIQSSYSSGYLTEYELAQRMGYDLCLINNEQILSPKKEKVPDNLALCIGDNSESILVRNMNPCSIDLKIADSGYLTPKRKLIDPQSIEHISSASDLWKSVPVYSSKYQSTKYFRLKPGMIVLTHTRDMIKIPDDCAGKIEIKSTFARLSLSITTGDFCNPGYKGYYPLEIKNNGKHTIIIHEGETMAQLMLVPLQGPILNEYPGKATFINNKGYDDGTPFSFWKERSIKALRKKDGTQLLLDLYDKILEDADEQNTDDVNGFKERFSNNFLPYCQKQLNKRDSNKAGRTALDEKKILRGYIKKEKWLKSFFMIKWGTGILSILMTIFPIFQSNIQGKTSEQGMIESLLHFIFPWGIIVIILLAATIFLSIFSPKVFCTFEKFDIDKVISEIRKHEAHVS